MGVRELQDFLQETFSEALGLSVIVYHNAGCWYAFRKPVKYIHFSNQKEPTYFLATSRILGIQLHVTFVLVFSMLSLILFFYPRSADQGELGTKSRVFHSHEIKSFTMTLSENLVLMERVLLIMEYKLTQNK